MSMRRVVAGDGVSLAVYEQGLEDAPLVLAVHGYPDDHTVWDEVVPLLAGEFRVVTYDVRGAGGSDRPTGRKHYRMPQLIDDLARVVEATAGSRAVHLLAHDWGSVQSWSAVTDPRLGARIASFTSISGPGLDQMSRWLRGVRDHPRAALRQFLHSQYVLFFQFPKLPELAIRRGLLETVSRRDTRRDEADELHGLWLYRANVLSRLGRPQPARVEVPVQLIVPEHDRYVLPACAIGAAEPWADDLTTHRVDAGHWVMKEAPELVAGLVRDFVRRPDQRPAGRPSSNEVPSSVSTKPTI
jgi:pimeloyl-ACP methyl ester carboxylesterase